MSTLPSGRRGKFEPCSKPDFLLRLVERCSIWPNDLVFKERRYMGVATYVKGDVQEVINALSDGRLDLAHKMVTKRIEMDEVKEEGFLTLINDKENQVKILVKGSGEK